MKEGLLKDKVALVTGGTSGIGKAIATSFAEAGAKVAIVGVDPVKGLKVAEEIGRGSVFYPGDVSSFAEADQIVKNVREHFGEVQILVNSAGMTRDQLLMRMSEEDWDRVMAVNVKSCYNFSHACVRPMLKKREGKIINVSSVVGLMGNAGQVNYAASKAAIVGFTKALARELASRNIHVNCIAPGYIDTRMTESLSDAQKEMTLAQIPLGRMGKPEDIASAALFLASSLSDYITGAILPVDGGMVMY